TEKMERDGHRAWAIKYYINLTPDQIKAASEAASVLFTPRMGALKRAEIIKSCSELTPEQIKERVQAIAEASPSLLTEEMSERDCAWIIKTCLTLTSEQIKVVAEAAPFLFTSKMDAWDRA